MALFEVNRVGGGHEDKCCSGKMLDEEECFKYYTGSRVALEERIYIEKRNLE